MELAESRILHFQALRAVAAKAEEDALTSIEACAERATSSASRTCKALQELSPETQPGLTNSEKNLRRQSFSGIMVLFQNSLNAYFTAQQAFRAQMEAKVSRQLRAAFPDADDAAVAAVASAGHRSASTAIQQTLLFQPGTTQLNTSVALTAARLRTDEVERLADVAAGLKKAFLDFENLVVSQGEVIDDIGRHIQATLEQTKHAVDTLQVAESAHRKRSWRNCVLMIVIAVALCILISVAVSRFF
jgi:t-SNARE complex subunit (syntaxin)